jgi:hypothetical protein
MRPFPHSLLLSIALGGSLLSGCSSTSQSAAAAMSVTNPEGKSLPLPFPIFSPAASAAQVALGGVNSTWVTVGSGGQLSYKTLPTGDRIMDFSSAGYGGGGVTIPAVPTVQTLSPSGGDDTASIQAALNAVSAMPLSNGFRGAVLLAPGTFQCGSTLNIHASGVVLRGSGNGTTQTTTTILMTGGAHTFMDMQGGEVSPSGSSSAVTDAYVPSGSTSFHVANASAFAVGDPVMIVRPVTAAWVAFMGMNKLVRYGGPETWLAVGSSTNSLRTISAIQGNQITLDVPLSDSFNATYLNPPGATLVKASIGNLIEQVGVENLAVTAPPGSSDTAMSISGVRDAWITNVFIQDTLNGIGTDTGAYRMTLDKVVINHTVTTHPAAPPMDFTINGSQILISDSSSIGKSFTWPLVTGSRGTGPNVALNFSTTQTGGISPHERWATGLLSDDTYAPNATAGAAGIAYRDRGIMGSGHGWTMGWGVAWNAISPYLLVQTAPGTENWCIGCIGSIVSAVEPGSGTIEPNGIYDSLNANVFPSSLYLAQLYQRLGAQGLSNIGYTLGTGAQCPATLTSSTLRTLMIQHILCL